ncbi:MAG: excinuclease ABC subunit UvrC [Dysgonamonadaceae bacterium]|jgi:excinuclease ABC subunit C|nr:excinuclease ABC subunit UvrC [Dysgonamonadaceae bacterium]
MSKEYENELLKKISSLSESAGCYLYKDRNETIIYVGKAKNLKKRVSSYFTRQTDPKVQAMLEKVRTVDCVLTESEQEAFLLENSLIKQHKPKYNILLKDDKTYPWIVIKNEPFPRIYLTRRKNDDGSKYYGPYASAAMARNVLNLLTTLYKIRTCNHSITKENVDRQKFKVCLQYHIKRCAAPCTGIQLESDYNENVSEAEEILRGNVGVVSRKIHGKMIKYSSELRFEEAQQLKDQYMTLENYATESRLVTGNVRSADVFSFAQYEKTAFVNCLHISNGVIISGYTIEYNLKLNEPKEQILAIGIVELRSKLQSCAKEVIVPFFPDIEPDGVVFTVPRRGAKHKLLKLSERNANQRRTELMTQLRATPERHETRILRRLQSDLHMTLLPARIECFDNSNMIGTNPVASCVVFLRAKPAKKEYRKFNVRTEGPNDYESMREIVFRRYKSVTDPDQLPQLIVVDGGKGQLSAAADSLKRLNLYGKVVLIGIAKRLEEIYFPQDPIPLYLDKNSESLKLIQRIRDEAHRFAITFHRNKRSKQQTTSALDNIPGIGKTLKDKLLTKYKSLKRIKDAPIEELEKLIGRKNAEKLLMGLNSTAE